MKLVPFEQDLWPAVWQEAALALYFSHRTNSGDGATDYKRRAFKIRVGERRRIAREFISHR